MSCTKYPTAGTRSVYFPQRSMNKAGLLGYAGNVNNNGIVALQVETASCIENIAEIAAVPGVDILFLGQNDLCMSMGLYEKYEFPHMYTSPELGAATKKLVEHARKNKVILGLFLFGTSRVGEFLEKGFTFISVGNDLHHVLTQAGAYVNDMEKIAKEKRKELEAKANSAILRQLAEDHVDVDDLFAQRSALARISFGKNVASIGSDWADKDICPAWSRGHVHTRLLTSPASRIPISFPKLICWAWNSVSAFSNLVRRTGDAFAVALSRPSC